MEEKHSNDWIRRRPLVVALMWALIPSGLALLLAPLIREAELRKVVYAGAITLLFGGFLGGMLKVLLDEVVAAKRRREDAAGFVTNVLADLKSVYDRVARAKILIPAHKSVKTYGEEMRDLIEACVQLRNVTRALERRAEGLDNTSRTEVTRRVKQMEKYLETLTAEFREHYKPLSDKQRGYEARAEVMVKAFADGKTDGEPPELPGFVWRSISTLALLSDFIGEGSSYKASFEDPLDDASELLRKELARIVGGAGGVWAA